MQRLIVALALVLSTAAGPAQAATGPVKVRVYLAPHGGLQRLERAVRAVSTPGRRRYRHFLSPAQFRARYGPTAARARRVKASLRAHGLTIVHVERHRRWVLARGPARAADSAFGTRPVVVPAAIRADVLAVSGLDGTRHTIRPAATLPPPDAVTEGGPSRPAHPCSRWYGQRPAHAKADGTPLPAFRGHTPPYAICGYGPRRIRTAYAGHSHLDGRGVTVAVVDAFASRTMRADANHWSRRHGIAPFRHGRYSQRLPHAFHLTGPPRCDPPEGWTVEESLDVEAVHAMAPAARVRYYGAPACDDPIDPGTIKALDHVVDENRASVVTNSYGNPEAQFAAGVRAGYEQAFLQAALQGITVVFSSGDVGAVPLFPGSDPYVTSVGGTSAAIGRHGHLKWQTGWGTVGYGPSADGRSWLRGGPLGGAGGGFSQLFRRPRWQHGVVPAGSPAGRGVPDVALDADGDTGLRVGQTQRFPSGDRYGELRIGGTSLAAPLMAGMQALAAQHAGGRLGWADPAIYRQARRHAGTFRDVTAAHDGRAVIRADYLNFLNARGGRVYTVRTIGDFSGFPLPLTTRRGWDPITGVGSPNRRYLTTQGR